MEYLNKDDYSHIKDIIDEFIGDTVLGNHLFKAIKVHFKRKEKTIIIQPIEEKEEILKKSTVYPNAANLQKMRVEADEALLRFNKNLRRKNGATKSKKKANN